MFFRYFYSYLMLIGFIVSDFRLHSGIERKIVVITCSYNNQKYYMDSLLSLFNQTHTDWTCYYIDDNSVDGTGRLAYDFANKYGMLGKIKFIINDNNLGAMENQYNAIHDCDDHDIIVILDGDDKFFDNNVLKFIYDTYCNPDIWLTYGTYIPMKEPFTLYCRDISKQDLNNKFFFRKHPFVFSHLRTFYAGLFKRIKKEDLMYEGKFLNIAADAAAMIPMLEMSNDVNIKHFKYIDKKLYVYNNLNPMCDFRRKDRDYRIVSFIRNIDPYESIETLF